MARENLVNARKSKGMTQKQVAEHIHTGERHYKKMEYGETLGSIDLWDKLEDLLNENQRHLRVMFDQGDSQ